MSTHQPSDPNWPRAAEWLAEGTRSAEDSGGRVALGVIGVPAYRTSITPTGAYATPGAIREALARYSTYSWAHRVDVAELPVRDFGDVAEPDGADGEQRVAAAVREAGESCDMLLALGGDNSITSAVVGGLMGERLASCGLVTIDAHHDLRDGTSNGSPVRRLIEARLPGENIVQIGIADFSNSSVYASRALEAGLTVVPRAEVDAGRLPAIVDEALRIAGAGGGGVFVDIDVDVCDRAAVPGCPSAAPGGLSAYELRRLAHLFASDARVRGLDITEIDATADSADGRTVRLAALLLLEIAAGVMERGRP